MIVIIGVIIIITRSQFGSVISDQILVCEPFEPMPTIYAMDLEFPKDSVAAERLRANFNATGRLLREISSDCAGWQGTHAYRTGVSAPPFDGELVGFLLVSKTTYHIRLHWSA